MNTSNKINGWLYLPALGLVLSCIVSTINYYKIIRLFLFKFINDQHIAYLFAFFIIIGGLIYLILLYVATFCFFKQKRTAQKAMITYYTWSFLLNGGVVLFSWLYVGIPVEMKEVGVLISASVGFFVWIPCFVFSKRIPIVFYK